MPSSCPTFDRTTVMIKPVGPACNLNCHYCYYLPVQDELYAGRARRMSLDTLEAIFAGLLPRFGPEVTIAWQGGEPTMAGLPFFEKALEFQRKHARPGQRIANALQTNATLLDRDWCRFFRDNAFLVGASLDGPPRLHDHYRKDTRGRASSEAVLRGLNLLKRHHVQYNVLCVLNDVNVKHPEEVLGYLLNRGARWVQFIPAIEWREHDGQPRLARFSPSPHAYGRFLCRLFDAWFDKHRHSISVRLFDTVLNKLLLNTTPLCILAESCHHQITIEHDGSVFGCDHYVQHRWQLAHVTDAGWTNTIRTPTPVLSESASEGPDLGENHPQPTVPLTRNELPISGSTRATRATPVDESWCGRIDTDRLATFAARKQHLPDACHSCDWLAFCHGGCPKHRPHRGDLPEPTVLCKGYRMFFAHAMERMQWLANRIRQGVEKP